MSATRAEMHLDLRAFADEIEAHCLEAWGYELDPDDCRMIATALGRMMLEGAPVVCRGLVAAIGLAEIEAKRDAEEAAKAAAEEEETETETTEPEVA